MIALLAGLAAGLSWGAADFIAGTRSRRAGVLAVVVFSQLAGLVSVAAVTGLAGARASTDAAAGLALLAGLLEGVAVLALYRALAVGTMSLVAPVAALGGVIPVGISIAMGERPPALALAGVAVSLVAATIAARAPGEVSRRGLGLAVVAALGFGGFFAILSQSGEGTALWAVQWSRIGSVALVLAVAVGARASLAVARADIGPIVAVGVLDAGAAVTFALAAETGLASVAVALGSLYPVATVILARTVLDEPLSPTQAASVGIALAGVGLIAFA